MSNEFWSQSETDSVPNRDQNAWNVPTALGRSLIVRDGAPAQAGWESADRVVIDEAALAAPSTVVRALDGAWRSRTPVVIDLHVDPTRFRIPESYDSDLWELGAGFQSWTDCLHFLVWANSYDARAEGEPIWWWGRKAVGIGATEGGVADVVLPDGRPAWIDGGPRGPLQLELAVRSLVTKGSGAATCDQEAVVVHAESVDLKLLTPQPAAVRATAELAADQLAAVEHGAGPARIIAPAGSGKTRVLTQRYRHLLVDRGYESRATIALAYNKKAQEEMASRLAPLDARIETINAWGYSLLSRALGRRPQVADEMTVRGLLENLLPKRQRRVNTDPIQPYIDGLALIRLGLRSPEEVEDSIDDVPGLAEAFGPYREALRKRGVIDFDEQVFGAVECLLRDGEFRRAMQREHRHVLVDELQDLTPAHMLLIRLVAGPAADVFGVGDDDQEIYGHVGADPRFLINYRDYFPGAAEHALQVNYRCPVAVTTAAATLLGYNHVRVPKTIEAGPDAVAGADTFVIETHPSEQGAVALGDVVRAWLAEPGASTEQVAVLARVRSLLLAPHVALSQAGIPVNSILGEDVLRRLGVRAALSYLRIATSPDRVDGSDLIEVYRRPSRGLPQWADKWLRNCRSVDSVAGVANQIDDAKVAAKFTALAGDLSMLCEVAATGATTRQLLLVIRDRIGLGSAMTLLDSTGGATGSHLDDLEALLQVADLHPDPAGFGGWLGQVFHREANEDGVTLSTIHRVKGREWDRVAVFGVTDGVVPHRLAADIEEERRVLHVGITRGRHRVVVLGDEDRRSPFLDELTGVAERRPLRAPQRVASEVAASPAKRAPLEKPITADVGAAVSMPGGYDGVVEAITETGISLRLAAGALLTVRFGERVTVDGKQGELAKPFSPLSEAVEAALRAWRTQRAKADGMPPYIVLSDKHLAGIADALPRSLAELRNCPGIGPAKLESYGDDIVEVIEAVRAVTADAGE